MNHKQEHRANASRGSKAALGFRAHSGWAVAVTVAGSLKVPQVIDRRRIGLVDPTSPGTVQPYHTVREWNLTRASRFIERSGQQSRRLACEAVRAIVEALAERGYCVVGCGLLLGAGRLGTSLGEILASHVMIHTAEGEFFRNALRQAAEMCGLAVVEIKEREAWSHCAAEMRVPSEAIVQRLKEIGRTVGRPWRQDEKLATLAACLALAQILDRS
jgi:hypothetical protein